MHSPAAPVPRPRTLLTAAELARVPMGYASSVLLDALTPARRRDGDGRPLLVLAGCYATDGLTRRVRGHLRSGGYASYGWGLARNYGLTDTIVAGVLARLDELHERHGAPVSLIGWSFGGLPARWLAHQRTAAVRQVVCLGSPWRAEGERTRATAPWHGCTLDAGARCENIVVPSSHVGLVSNPLALAALSDRLAQDPEHPQPFDWTRCLRHALVGRIAAVA